MSKDKVLEHLDGLKEEITKLEESDESTRDRLTGLTEEIEDLLEKIEDKPDSSALLQNLQTHVEHFEIEHPKITGVLSQIINTLTSMGI